MGGGAEPLPGGGKYEPIPDNEQDYKGVVGGEGQLSPRGLSKGRMDDRRLLGEDSNPRSSALPHKCLLP